LIFCLTYWYLCSSPFACATECGSGRSWKFGESWIAPWTAAVRPPCPWTDPFASTSSRPPIVSRWARSSGRCSTRCYLLCTSTPAWSPAPRWRTTSVPVSAWPGGWSTRRRRTTWTWTSTWVGFKLLFNRLTILHLRKSHAGFLRPEKHERHPQADRRSDLIKAFLWPALMQNNQCAFKAVVATWASS